MKKILVLRFSAMGDVVLLLPVIRSLVERHHDVEVTIVTRPKFAPFFYGIERVQVFVADVDYTYNGVFGMRNLFRDLMRKSHCDVVIDVHDHLRTKILRTYFRILGVPVVVFDKGRGEKKALTRKKHKLTQPLPHTVDRYAAAFVKAGFTVQPQPGDHFVLNPDLEGTTAAWLESHVLAKREPWIGIAPFAMHTTKIWPVENYAKVIEILSARTGARFFLFGGGKREIDFFEELKRRFSTQCVVVAGQLKLRQEISLMKRLDLMLCVDSSNMHLAALAGVPLVSIWGGTHTDAGFGPYGRDKSSVIGISRHELPCRPCSVYGREHCYVGGYPCLTRITPEMVVARIEEHLK